MASNEECKETRQERLRGEESKIEFTDHQKHLKNSVATQCNLLDAPPLELLEPSFSLVDSFAEPEEADRDKSFCISQEENTTE